MMMQIEDSKIPEFQSSRVPEFQSFRDPNKITTCSLTYPAVDTVHHIPQTTTGLILRRTHTHALPLSVHDSSPDFANVHPSHWQSHHSILVPSCSCSRVQTSLSPKHPPTPPLPLPTSSINDASHGRGIQAQALREHCQPATRSKGRGRGRGS